MVFFVPSFAGCARAAEKRCLYILYVDMYLFLDYSVAVTWILCALFLPAHSYAWNSFRALSCAMNGSMRGIQDQGASRHMPLRKQGTRGLPAEVPVLETGVVPGLCSWTCVRAHSKCSTSQGTLPGFLPGKAHPFRGYHPGTGCARSAMHPGKSASSRTLPYKPFCWRFGFSCVGIPEIWKTP